MPSVCAVLGCGNNASKFPDKSYYRLPAINKRNGMRGEKLSRERQGKWLANLLRTNLSEAGRTYLRVCSDHFLSGRPAHWCDTTNPDWAPTQNLGHNKVSQEKVVIKCARYKRCWKGRGTKIMAGQALMDKPYTEPHTDKFFHEDRAELHPVLRGFDPEDKTAAATLHQALDTDLSTTVKSENESTDDALENESTDSAPENEFTNDALDSDSCITVNREITDDIRPENFVDSILESTDDALENEFTNDAVDSDSCLTVNREITDDIRPENFVDNILESTDDALENESTDSASENEFTNDALDSDSCITVKREITDDIKPENFVDDILSENITIPSVTWVEPGIITDSHTTDSSTMTDMYASYIASLEQECRTLRSKCYELEKRDTLLLAEEAFKGNDAKVKYFTGLPTFGVLMDTFSFISDHLEDLPRLTKFQQYVLTLMRLKHNSSVLDLSYRFDVNVVTVSKVFYSVLGVCMTRLVPALVSWPERELSECNFPMALVNDFPKCAAIINCFEIDIGLVPVGEEERKEACINHKPHTMKYLIAVSPQGSLSYISEGWMGTYSDKRVAENCGVLDNLGPEDEILADVGFNMATRVCLYGTALTEGKKEMFKIKVDKTKMSAEVQSYVGKVLEPAYAAGRKYAMLQSAMPSSLLKKVAVTGFTALDQVVCVACALTSVAAAAKCCSTHLFVHRSLLTGHQCTG